MSKHPCGGGSSGNGKGLRGNLQLLSLPVLFFVVEWPDGSGDKFVNND